MFIFDIQDQKYAFYFLSIPFWLQTMTGIVAESLATLPTALLIYYLIVKPQKQAKRQRIGTTLTGYLLGWGVLLPVWIFVPAHAASAAGVTNLIMRFSLCVIFPTVSIFRTLEAMYGFTPTYATETLAAFAFYFCSPMRFQRDPSTASLVPASTGYIVRHKLKFLAYLFLTGAYQSLLIGSEHFPNYGEGPASTPAGFYEWKSLLDKRLWKDSLQWAVLLQLYLSAFAEGLMFATALISGKKTDIFSDNPIFASTSPSDFWGRRWNLVVHHCLKNGAFKPVLSLGGPPWLAVLAAFFASALFHEWLLPSVFYNYPNTHGVTLVFFLWQAGLVVTEAAVGHWFTGIANALPKALRTALVILAGIPAAHWFCDTYVRSNFFIHGQIALPMVLMVSTENEVTAK